MESLQPYIKEKISDLSTGLFYAFNPGVLKIPNTIIKIYKVGDYGCLWFTISSPYPDMSDFDGFFPCRLQLYNKSCNDYIVIEGEAIFPELQNASWQVDDSGKWPSLLVMVEFSSLSYFRNSAIMPQKQGETLLYRLHKLLYRRKRAPALQYH